MKVYSIASLVALGLAAFATVLSIFHGGPPGQQGPRGPVGPQGNAGKAAQLARLGICWEATDSTSLQALSYDAIAYMDIEPAIVSDGVYTCPQGMTFVSVVPGPAPSNQG